jgi:DNA polymerase delta subunit 1
MDSPQFQAIAWDGRDQDDQYTIRIFGRSENGKSVSLGTKFNPYFYLKTSAPQEIVKSIFWRGLVSCKLQHLKDLWGFQNGELSRFLRLEFKTHKALRNCAWAVENRKHEELKDAKVYESNIDPVLRFMHVTGIPSTGWIDPGICEPDEESTCEINLWAPDWHFIKPVARDDFAPIRIMSFDIECYSSTGGFPDAKRKEDVVFQIGMTTKEFGKPGWYDRKCLCLKETQGYEWFKTEKELLQAFEEYLIKVDPDIITGWNIFGFDLEYLVERATLYCGLQPVWGRVREDVAELVTKNLSSSALGNNLLKMVPMKGRYVFDLFQDVKREHKLESYSLNNVSKHFLKDQKLDMPPKEIFSRFLEGDATKLGEVAEYCIKDTELPHALMEKLCQIQNVVEMAKACWVPLAFLSERGQQIKVFSQMAKKARELNFVIPTFKRTEVSTSDEDGYQGATVLEAQTGAYYAPITALDFASLYPSIMCAENLCYSTLVMDSKYDNLPGVQYEVFGPHKFAQGVPSLLPVILTELKAYRKKAKKLMAATEGTPMEAVYNGQQLAYKVSMNSIYGFTGASKGMLPCVAIASTVTFRGRQMIEQTKNYVEEHFPGAKVRYGDTDSVMVEFDVQGRKGQEAIDYSWELGEQASEQCTKLFKAPNDLELEKIYCPYFLYSKKRYAAKMYEKKGDAVVFKKIDVKGLQVVRRDSCPYVRETLKQLLGMILESSDPRPVIDAARDAARILLDGKVPIEKLLLSKQLTDTYKVKLGPKDTSILKTTLKHLSSDDTRSIEGLIRTGEYKIKHEEILEKVMKKLTKEEQAAVRQVTKLVPMPHFQVRTKMKMRAPGSEPQQGDRVSFVVAKGPGKLFEKAEDPGWVREHSVPLDYDYYFTNQLKKPVQDLLEPLVSADDIFDKKFMVKSASTSEMEARKAFLSKFGLKVSTVQ